MATQLTTEDHKQPSPPCAFQPRLDRCLPGELPAVLGQRHRLTRQQLPHRHFQLLTPAITAAGPEVEHLAAVAEPGLLGRQGGRLLALPFKPPQAPSPDGGAGLLSSRCSGGWCPLERGPFGEERSCAGRRPRLRLRSVSPGTRAERVRRCRTLALGWVVFFAAAGGCGIGFWIARRLARGCSGRRLLWDRGGGRWLAGALRCDQRCWMPGFGRRSARPFSIPGAHPAGLD
jgi:hypothetical protein